MGVVVVPAFEVVIGSGVDAGVDFVGDEAELLDGEEGPAEHGGAFGWELCEGFEEGVVAAEEAVEVFGAAVAVGAGLAWQCGQFVVDEVAEGFERGFEAVVAFGASGVLVCGGGCAFHA